MVSQKTTLDYQKIANLVEQVKADDGEAFAELYSLTYQKFYYFAYMLLQNEQDSQDILQDSYLEILQSIHKLNNNTAFVAWAERIIYHSCMKFKNKQVEIPVEQDELPLPQNDSMSPISQAESKELSQVLFSMILDLDPGFRAVIFMRYVEQFKIAEIAEILECPLGTVKSRIHLAKKQLRRAALASKHKNVLLYTMCFFPLRLSLWKIAAFLPSPAEGAGTSFMEISQAHWGSTLSYKPSGTSSMPQHFSSLIKLAGISCGCAGIVITSAIALNQSNGCIQTIEVSTPYVKTATLSVTLSSPEDVFQLVLSDSSGTVLSAVSPSERSSYHFSILQNGTYTIEARTENSCLETAEIAVTSVDNEDPYILDYSYSQENDFLEIVVKDNQSGINYSQLMALTASGSALTPTSVDLEKGVLIYPIPPEDFILTLTDLAGNQSQHLVKIQKKYI